MAGLANAKGTPNLNPIPTGRDHTEQLPGLGWQRPSARCCRSSARFSAGLLLRVASKSRVAGVELSEFRSGEEKRIVGGRR